jgi:O-antigen/teichoic acid export membrane protein
MQPRYIRSLFFLLFLNLLIKPLWLLGIDRNVQNIVGTETFGLYYALLNLSLYLQIVLDPGIHTYNNKALVREPQRLGDYLSSLLPFKLILSGIYLALTFALALLIGFKGGSIHLLWWIAANQVLASLLLYMRSNLAGLYLFNTDSIFSVLDRLLMILICGALIWGRFMPGPFRIEWFIYAQTGATAAAALGATIIVLRKSKSFRPQIRWKELSRILRNSYPFALLGILMTLYSRIDSIMIERMLPDGAYHAGVYASAYRLLDAANMIAFLFSTILLPVFAGMVHKNESVGQITSICSRLLLVPGLLLVLASYFYRNQIMHMLYREAGPYSAEVFGFLMIGFLALCMMYVYGTLLTANGNMRFLNVTASAGVIGNVLLNIILIPKYQAVGAVIATLVTQFAVTLWQVLKAHRVFGLKLDKGQWIRPLLYCCIAVGSFAFLHALNINWILNMALLILFNLTFAVGSGLLNIKFFLNIIKLKA